VEVEGKGTGIIAMDNEDGTWNVELDDSFDCDVPASQLTLCSDQCIDELRSHIHGWPNDIRSGIEIIDPFSPKEKPKGWTRVVCFSDTHGRHDKIPIENMPEADILLHAGDLTNTGELEQIESFNKWLSTYPATHKIVIAGNHDTTLDTDYYKNRGGKRFHQEPYDCTKAHSLLSNCIYLENESVEVVGYNIYGSPYTPEFCDWAFNLQRGAECSQAWEAIPDSIDILITHGPARGYGDQLDGAKRAGCVDLRYAIEQRNIPLHVFGHIHNSYGCVKSNDESTLHVNASTCTHQYSPTNPPILLDLPPPDELRGNMIKEAHGEVGNTFSV